MVDPTHVQRLTRHYPGLRGLTGLPFWLGFGLVTVTNGLGLTRTSGWAELLILGVSLAAMYPIKRYYDREFGVVRKTSAGTGPIWLLIWILIVAAFVAIQIFSLTHELPVALGLWVIAAYFASMGLADRGFRWHWLVPSAALVLLSLRGLLDLERGESHILFGVVFSATAIFACVFDHRLLVRSLRDVHA